MEKKIYLAGKISKHNWRNKILNTSRIDEERAPYILDSKFEYVGPYFIGCDHGCFHGDNTHGRLLDEEFGCCCEDYETRSTTISKCYKWIDLCDIMFCWIDDITAYGTFTEIGYAYAKNKKIYIACDKKIGKEALDIWFPLLSSDILIHEDNIEDAWSNFLEWYNNGMKQKVKKIHNRVSDSQYRFILRLLAGSKYELVDDSIDLSNIDSETAGKIIAVLKNKNKTIDYYNIGHILKVEDGIPEKEPFWYIEKSNIIKMQISNFLKKNVSFKIDNENLVDISCVNNIDRYELASDFVNTIIKEKTYSFISGEDNLNLFMTDVAKRIDAILPRQYYTEYTLLKYPELSSGFITDNFLGKNHYDFTKNLTYQFEENNSELAFEQCMIDNRINIHDNYEKALSMFNKLCIQKEKKKLANMTKEERFKYNKKLRQKNNELIPATQPQIEYLISLADKNGYSIKNIEQLDIDNASDLIDALKNNSKIKKTIKNKFID